MDQYKSIDIDLSHIQSKNVLMGLDLPMIENYYDTFSLALKHQLKACQISRINISNIFDIIQTRKLLSEHPEMYTCFHSNLIYNLAGSAKGSMDPQYNRKLNNTKRGLLLELDIATMIGTGLIVHIGNNIETRKAYNIIAQTINEILILENCNTISYAKHSGIPLIDFKTKRKIILENSAGQGNSIGKSLDEISIITSLLDPNLRDNLRVCIDTCHACDAAEYNFGDIEHTRKFYADFSQKLGISKLEVFHMNDSKHGFGSKADRHEHLTYGHIFQHPEGLKSLKYFVNHAADVGIPLIGEYSDGLQDVKLVNSLLKI